MNLKTFTVVIEQDEDGMYVAKVPDIVGCYTQGKTVEQAMERIKEAISCHSLRKGFANALYENGVDLTRIQALLNHSSPKETLRYIGITQSENDLIYMELNL